MRVDVIAAWVNDVGRVCGDGLGHGDSEGHHNDNAQLLSPSSSTPSFRKRKRAAPGTQSTQAGFVNGYAGRGIKRQRLTRASGDGDISRQRIRKNSPLGTTSLSVQNVMALPRPTPPSLSCIADARSPSPSKRNRNTRGDGDENAVDDATPRPAKRGRARIPQHSSRPPLSLPIVALSQNTSAYVHQLQQETADDALADARALSGHDAAASDASSSAFSGKSQARSTSPKKVADLKNTGSGVHLMMMPKTRRERQEQLGPLGIQLYKDMEALSNKRGIFPSNLEQMLEHEYGWSRDSLDECDIDIEIDSTMLYNAEGRSLAQVRTEWDAVSELVASATICADECDCEAEWNHRVHFEALKMVFKRSAESRCGFRSV